MYEKDIVEHIFFLDKEFYAEYQPVVELETGDIVAYEALARFTRDSQNVAPDKIFGQISDDKLVFQLEKTIKKFQVDRKPINSSLFLNLDPRCILNESQMREWISLFNNQSDIYIEVTEDIDLDTVKRIKKFIELSSNTKVHIGLDNFANEKTLTSFDLFYQVDFIKLDKVWFRYLNERKSQRIILEAIIKYAKEEDVLIVMEGAETKEHVQLAKNIGVDYIQGYYFKDKFITKEAHF
jgi:EAL domain-containing protein (putative c-di-GMP-specific phosphodiesterase class I)